MLGGSRRGRLAGEKGFGVAAWRQRPSMVAAPVPGPPCWLRAAATLAVVVRVQVRRAAGTTSPAGGLRGGGDGPAGGARGGGGGGVLGGAGRGARRGAPPPAGGG